MHGVSLGCDEKEFKAPEAGADKCIKGREIPGSPFAPSASALAQRGKSGLRGFAAGLALGFAVAG